MDRLHAILPPMPTVAVDSIGPLGEGELGVMSFNLRVAVDPSPHSWEERRPVVGELLTTETPHLLGTQEGLYRQVRDVAAILGQDYEWVGMGREGGSRDEFLAVFFDTRRLDPVEFDHFWLSETPDVVGSRSWETGCVRMATWVRFRDRQTGHGFVTLNTHLDDASEEARRGGAAVVASVVADLADTSPVIVTGDFNCHPRTSHPYTTLVEDGGLVDTWETAQQRGAEYGSAHAYGPLVAGGTRIDWILTTPDISTRAVLLNPLRRHGRYPSDHLPLQAALRLE